MIKIKETIKCKICQNIYAEPVLLPCDNTICKEHISEKSFNCSFCLNNHSIGQEFKLNLLIQSVIDSNKYLNEQEKLLKSDLVNLDTDMESLTKELELVEAGFGLLVYEHFSSMINKIDIQRETEKLKIDNHSNTMIARIREYEETCRNRLDEIGMLLELNKQKAKELKVDLANELRRINFVEANLVELKQKMNEQTNLLRDTINEIEEMKIKLNECKFEPNCSANDQVLGTLIMVNGIKLISCSGDKKVKIFDVKTGLCDKTLEGHTAAVYGIEALSHTEIATCSLDQTIKIWNIRTGSCVKTITNDSPIYCLKKLSNNELLSGSKDGKIKVWRLDVGLLSLSLDAHSDWVRCFELCGANGFISCSDDSKIKIWDLKSGECAKTLQGHKSDVYCLKKFSNEHLASGSLDKTIRIWDLSYGVCIKILYGHKGWISYLDINANNELVSCSFDKTIKVWNIKTGICLKTLNEHTQSIRCIKMYSNDKLVSCASNKVIKFWDLRSGKCIKTLNEHESHVNFLQVIYC